MRVILLHAAQHDKRGRLRLIAHIVAATSSNSGECVREPFVSILRLLLRPMFRRFCSVITRSGLYNRDDQRRPQLLDRTALTAGAGARLGLRPATRGRATRRKLIAAFLFIMVGYKGKCEESTFYISTHNSTSLANKSRVGFICFRCHAPPPSTTHS